MLVAMDEVKGIYEFIDEAGFVKTIEAMNYAEACRLYREYVGR